MSWFGDALDARSAPEHPREAQPSALDADPASWWRPIRVKPPRPDAMVRTDYDPFSYERTR